MAKLLLLSILASVIVIPVLAARDPNPQRGFKRALFFFLAYCLFFVVALRFVSFQVAT
jgi:nitrate reductase NapE component